MNDSLTKLFQYLEPKISNIQDIRVEVKSLKEVHETLEELMALGQNSYHDILNFYDQDFIIRTIKISQDKKIDNVDDYLKAKYLLKSSNSIVQELPQYKEAITYMEKLFTYLADLNLKVNLEYDELKNNLEELEILNKYSILLKKNNIFIEEPDNFLLFLNLVDIKEEDKLNILILVNECNIKNYLITNDILLSKDLYLSNITNILDAYQNEFLKEYEYESQYELNTKILISKNINNSNNLDIELENKKIYLIHKIKDLYDKKQYDELIKYYKEFQEINIYQEEFRKQKYIYNDKYSKNIIFLRKENKLVINDFLNSCLTKYKACVYKNLLDIENSKDLVLPDYIIENLPIYIKKEFLVKTVYMFLENGLVLVLGIIEDNQDINTFIKENLLYIKKMLRNVFNLKDLSDRDILLKDINIEDLVLTIDLDTLNMNGG